MYILKGVIQKGDVHGVIEQPGNFYVYVNAIIGIEGDSRLDKEETVKDSNGVATQLIFAGTDTVNSVLASAAALAQSYVDTLNNPVQ